MNQHPVRLFVQTWLNYLELLEGKDSVAQEMVKQPPGVVDRIMFSEREAAFCSVLNQAGQSGNPTIPP